VRAAAAPGSGRHEHPQEYISDDACAVEDGQCDERNPNPLPRRLPKCRAMPLHTPVSQRPSGGGINGMRAGSNGSGDDVILLLCRAQGVAAGVLPGVQGTIRVFPERCGSGRAV